MTPSPEDPAVAESIRRVRRGCMASALIVAALTALFVSATGNLAFLLLLLVAAALVLMAQFVVR